MKNKLALLCCLISILAIVPCASAGYFDLTGTIWTGTAEGAVGGNPGAFTSYEMTLTILTQQDNLFYGQMQFGNEDPFPVSGAIYQDFLQKKVRITGSESVYEATLQGFGKKLYISGTGSRLDPSDIETIIFKLHKDGITPQ